MKITILIMCAALILCGCDPKKDERNALQSELDAKRNSLLQIEQKIRSTETIQANLNSEVVIFTKEFTKYEANIKDNKESLSSYVISHKFAVTLVASTDAGIAGILADNNMDDKEHGFVTWAIEKGYCLANRKECLDATTQITYYGKQIAYYKDEANKKNEGISLRRQRLAELEQSNAPLLAERATFLTKIDGLKSQISLLSCSGLFCF